MTEILYALGLDDRIIAVDTTSVFPPAAMREKPNVGYMRQLSAEGVLSVSPTLILAEDGSGPPDTITLLEKASLPFVLVPNEKSAEGVAEKVRFVGDAMGVAAESDRLADALASDFATLQAEIAPIEKRVRALFVFSLTDGRILAGGSDTSAEAMLKLAGAENAISGFSGYKPVNTEAVLAAAPEAIVVMTRYGDDSGPGVDVADILADPTLSQTPAGKAKRVVSMNGQYLLGFGPRAAHAARDLAAALYPDRDLPPLASHPWIDIPAAGQ